MSVAKLQQFAQEARKFLVGAAGVIALLLSQGVVPDPERGWLTTALGVLTAAGIYYVKNEPPAG